MNILVIDDHPLFIDGISHALKSLSESINIIKATSGLAAIEQLSSDIEFDLILLDLNMPNLDGISLLHRFKVDELCVPVVIVSSEEQAGLIKQTLDWGAMGFIPKWFSAEQICSALQSVLDGNIYLPQPIQDLLHRISNQPNAQQLVINSGISNKQFEVLNLLSKGYSNEQIATIMHRTEHTVKSHISALFQILGASSRLECVEIARQRGLFSD